MTVQDLITELECLDGDVEVRFASQPSWPFEYSIDSVVQPSVEDAYEVCIGDNGWQVEDVGEDGEVLQDGFDTCEDAETWLNDRLEREGEKEPVVYLSEGTQLGYLPGFVSKTLGWR